ncbi:50S ribosomal protein L32e [Picrophilus oshimae]|uniref:Large ribosomal subunit protein eL32 n=2 Tax=Picrophilus torridus (strain ATCC 700027 / DSM 9790 / JCM 10055 / NBRC 100828 / KAW 2/3) TaxID=1122961 RepID=RL32_PICTO|nr:50S ribosomal protein L32e [Picrophilus oshimae]Q6L1B0.1 RecName: Full=Large ribosomal subunit protein eL32; AltName: Full=50S ribosomal protein L32e [Picrophilus oshimae DSM 9789]AAT43242.1 large subunit ribosomal protein L32E [Picrophilus oshimae DSM 9789]SMD30452.1 LSU ribosomal protein L32E [Picrophilus oshimae DSM 9789]
MSEKPLLSKDEKRLLKIKNRMSRKRVEFRRQEWFRYKKFNESWRKPRGKHSKLREHLGYRPPVVDAGYRSPAAVRGLHPSGFAEKLVYNVNDLKSINPDREGARIASSVGMRKRKEIEEEADNLGIHVFNRVVK